MAEPNKERRNRLGPARRGQRQAANQIRDNREALSQGRRAIYEQGEYEPEPTRRSGSRPLSAAEVATIKQQIQAGQTQQEVATALGIHLSSVVRVCKILMIEVDERLQLLARHDAGLCGKGCRLGRHGYRL